MLALRLHVVFTPKTIAEASSVLRSLIGPVRAEPGCRATRLLTDTGREGELIWVEEWVGIDDFEQHLRSQAFRQILAVIELADAPPEIEIDDVNSRRGFELIEELLGAVSTNPPSPTPG